MQTKPVITVNLPRYSNPYLHLTAIVHQICYEIVTGTYNWFMKYGQYKIPTVFVVHPHRFAYQYDKEEDIRAVTVLISSFVNSLLYGFWHHRTIVEKASSADNCFESLLEKMMKRKVIEDYRLLSDYKTKEDVLTAYSENYFANMNASGGCVEQSLASGGYFWLFPARVIN